MRPPLWRCRRLRRILNGCASPSIGSRPARGRSPPQKAPPSTPAELPEGYRVAEGFYDHRPLVLGAPGQLGMDAENAIKRGVSRKGKTAFRPPT